MIIKLNEIITNTQVLTRKEGLKIVKYLEENQYNENLVFDFENFDLIIGAFYNPFISYLLKKYNKKVITQIVNNSLNLSFLDKEFFISQIDRIIKIKEKKLNDFDL